MPAPTPTEAQRAVAAGRLERTTMVMAEHELDLLIIAPSADQFYLLGRRMPLTERLSALAIPVEGPPTMIVPKLQRPLLDGLPIDAKVIDWDETQDPIALVAELARRHGARSLAVNDHLWSGFLLRLQQAVPDAQYRDGAEVLSRLRRVKDDSEIAGLREATRRFDALWGEFCTTDTLIGRTEFDIQTRLRELMTAHGMEEIGWCDVGSGPNGASPLHHWSHRVVEPGDPVVIDFAASLDGYWADTCRTPVAGEPDPAFVEIYDIDRAAHEAAQAAIRPGVSCQEIDRAARRVIADAGYGSYFIHRVGHGIGIDAHEHPYIVEGNETPLEPGMTFSNEPGIYIPGRWGVRIENITAVTQDGCEVFSTAPKELISLC